MKTLTITTPSKITQPRLHQTHNQIHFVLTFPGSQTALLWGMNTHCEHGILSWAALADGKWPPSLPLAHTQSSASKPARLGGRKFLQPSSE